MMYSTLHYDDVCCERNVAQPAEQRNEFRTTFTHTYTHVSNSNESKKSSLNVRGRASPKPPRTLCAVCASGHSIYENCISLLRNHLPAQPHIKYSIARALRKPYALTRNPKKVMDKNQNEIIIRLQSGTRGARTRPTGKCACITIFSVSIAQTESQTRVSTR